MKRSLRVGTLVAFCLAACAKDLPPAIVLSPDPNPMPETDPLWSPMPHRDRPRAICVSEKHHRAWVMLSGIEDDAGRDVAIIDLDRQAVASRITLEKSPWSCALDSEERYVAVTLRFANRAVILDAATNDIALQIPVPFYSEGVIWSKDGTRLFFANRWADSVFFVDLVRGSSLVQSEINTITAETTPPFGTPVGDNPGSLALSADGTRLFVGLVAGADVSVLDTSTGQLIDADNNAETTTPGAPNGISRLGLHSPVGGLAVSGPFLFVADVGRGLGAKPHLGRDMDNDGAPGDGTANVMFQDLQNEIGVIDTRSLKQVDRYTSDSVCCRDFRDVDPDHPDRGLLLPEPDLWPPEVLAFLPPKSKWIVAGALPEAMTVRDETLWVAFAGSNEVQSFSIHADGSLTPDQTAGSLYKTGYNPKAIATYGDRIITVDRLAEALSIIDPMKGPDGREEVIVGDVAGGRFPATDAELGEGINEMTAVFTIDGDQTCVHCHRENGAIARPVMMPLQVDRNWGARNILAQRGLFNTRPWFFESAMDETNFFPVLNEFARKENYCCEGADPTVWSKYPALETCRTTPTTQGCEQVLHCESNPPPECAARPYAFTPHLRRSQFIKEGARKLFGRDTTFGDALTAPGPNGTRIPIALDFDGLTRAVGLFMLRTPRLLPNPNSTLPHGSSDRGRQIYENPAVGCQGCHPLPLTTTALQPNHFSPDGMPVRFPPVVSPTRSPSGTNASLITGGFLAAFPDSIQGPAGLHIGATLLRGIWDRPSTRFLHDGRGRSLREVLASPGHPVLLPGEVGRNERDGVLDTHGGTSHLDRYELEDLMNFLLTL